MARNLRVGEAKPPLYQLGSDKTELQNVTESLSDSNVFAYQVIPSLSGVGGSTMMAWVTYDGHILVGADGLGFRKKIFEFDYEKKIKRRIDDYDDFTEDFSEGSESKKYYAELFQIMSDEYGISVDEKMDIEKHWLWRKSKTALDDREKTGCLGSSDSNRTIYASCGTAVLTESVLAILRDLKPEPKDIREWAFWANHYLSTLDPKIFGYAEGDKQFYGNFIFASHVDQKPLVFLLDRTDEPKEIPCYACIGAGSVLGYKILNRHYPKIPVKQLAVLRMREAFEACFIMKYSGGTTHIVSLDKDNNYKSEFHQKIGCI